MLKTTALRLLGGNKLNAAAVVGVSPSAISTWPDELPARIADRVLAVQARRYLPPYLLGEEGTKPAQKMPKPPEPEPPADPAA